MFIIGKWSVKVFTHYVVILISALQVRTSLVCIQGKQYYNATEKECLPCTTCTSPFIVIAACEVYSNAKCGLASFNNGLHIEVLQEEVSEDKGLKQGFSPNGTSTLRKGNGKVLYKGVKKQKIFKKCKRKCKKKNRRKKYYKKVAKVNPSSLNEKENLSIILSEKSKENIEIENNQLENVYNLSEIITVENISRPVYKEDSKQNSSVLSISKYFIIFAVVTFNIILVTLLIIKLICFICQKRSEDKNSAYSNKNQKLPHPSQKPVKCRFTAILPSKSPMYANVDTYLKPISMADSSTTQDSTRDSICPSTIAYQTTQEPLDVTNRNPLSLNAEIDPTLNPLLASNQEEIERANTIQLYTRIPSPNPFTMDRLLEQRRAVGYSSVENNLYVETWCSSPSPMLPRSQESSVAPSPALSGVQKPFAAFSGVTAGSNTSSPLTTRTFRATPAFTSFHPYRS